MTSLLRALLPEQRRALDANLFGIATEPDQGSTAGVSVTQQTALTLSAVYGVARLLANDIGGLPLHVFRSVDGGRRRVPVSEPAWVDQPNPNDPNETGADHRAQVVASMVLAGDGFVMANPQVGPDVVELHVLKPDSVSVKRAGDGAPIYLLSDGPTKASTALTAAQCLHVPLFRLPGEPRGLSPIEAMRRGIGRGIAAEEAGARLFSQGSLISGLVEYPREAGEPDETQVKEVLRGLNRRHRGVRNAWVMGALTGGATFHELSMKPRDAQAIETEEWTLEQFCRLLGVPPSMVGSQKPGAVAYASVEQRSIDYVVHAVVPLVIRLEKAYQRLLGPNLYIKLNVAALMRGDVATRANFYRIALQNKWMTRDEVRVFEDLEPMGLGFLETPINTPPEQSTKDEGV